MKKHNNKHLEFQESEKKLKELAQYYRRRKRWVMAIILFIAFIVGTIVVGVILSSLGLISRLSLSTNKPKENDLENKIMAETNPLLYQEPGFGQILGYEAIVEKLGKCLSETQQSKFKSATSCKRMTEDEVKSLLDKTEITFHSNSKLHQDSEITKSAIKNLKKIFGKYNSKIIVTNPKQQLEQLKQLFTHVIMQSSSLSQRLARIYFLHDESKIANYEVKMLPEAADTGAQYVMRNHTIRLFGDHSGIKHLLPHEIGHSAGASITYTDPTTILPVLQVDLDKKQIKIQPMLANVFPCDLEGEVFYKTWLNELENNILLFKDQVFNSAANMQDPKYKKFLHHAASFYPSFSLILPTDDVERIRNQNIKVGHIFSFSSLNYDFRLFPLDIISQYVPKGRSSDSYYQSLFAKSKLQLEEALDLTGDYAGITRITITPLQMELTIRVKYFINFAQEKLNYVKSYHSKGQGYCQEAFGCLLEFNEAILRAFFPHCYDYLHQRLDEYESNQNSRAYLGLE